MTPEHELLLLFSRQNLTPQDQTEALRLLEAPLDWSRVLHLCREHTVYPCLYDNLRKRDFAHVPSDIRDRLQGLYKFSAFRNQLFVDELRSLLELFDSQQIPAVPLKGVTLGQSLYGNINLRSSVDIDVLVPPEHARRSLNLLESVGYTPALPGFQDELLRSQMETQLLTPTRIGTKVDLHWALLWTVKLDKRALDDLWADCRSDVVFGSSAKRMSPEWEFLFLCSHAARNGWGGLKGLADIHDMCCVREMNWPRVFQKADALAWTRIVETTLAACHTLFKTPIPPGIPLHASRRWLKLFPSHYSVLGRTFLPVHWLSGADRTRYVARMVFIEKPEDWKYAHFLPRYARFLYTPIRLARLVAKWTPRLISAVIKAH